jgi:uncharacterized protein
MSSAMSRLRRRYKDATIRGVDTSSYLRALTGMGIALVALRTRILDERPRFLAFSGTCMPGDKIAVHVDGKLDMCERVNGTYPIGFLDEGGIDYKRVRDIIERYRRQVTSACAQCPATKLCGICFSFAEHDDGFRRVDSLCAGTIDNAKQRLADYVSILEENPRADFRFETDTSRFEERLLLNY